MVERSYNGVGKWSVDSVKARYRDYAAHLCLDAPRELSPKVFEKSGNRWVYPVMERVIEGIEAKDPACVLLGIEFIEEDRKFPFGAGLKMKTARALRRVTLSGAQSARVRRRIVNMLIVGNTPREYKEYAKLLRKLGVEKVWKQIEAGAPRKNRYAMRYYEYFRAIHEHSASVERRER